MKQLKVKMTFTEVQTLDRWIDALLIEKACTNTWANKCCIAVLYDWQLKKLKPKAIGPVQSKIRFTLPAPVCLAFAHVITVKETPVTSFIGNSLHQLYTHIYHEFEANQLT